MDPTSDWRALEAALAALCDCFGFSAPGAGTEARSRSRQKCICIGHFDAETGEWRDENCGLNVDRAGVVRKWHARLDGCDHEAVMGAKNARASHFMAAKAKAEQEAEKDLPVYLRRKWLGTALPPELLKDYEFTPGFCLVDHLGKISVGLRWGHRCTASPYFRQ